jgi:hypothetical protein
LATVVGTPEAVLEVPDTALLTVLPALDSVPPACGLVPVTLPATLFATPLTAEPTAEPAFETAWPTVVVALVTVP